MKASGILLVLVAILLGGGLLVGVMFISGRNTAVTLDESVKSQWSQVENQLQRRYDLIPNVVSTVKGVAEQEKTIFLGIAEARKAYVGAANQADKVKAANQVESALARLLVIQESYPELKSNQAFHDLTVELEGTENRLSVERGKYNDVVKELNSYVRGFPSGIWAGMAGVHEAEYFKVEEAAKANPKVDFGTGKEQK